MHRSICPKQKEWLLFTSRKEAGAQHSLINQLIPKEQRGDVLCIELSQPRRAIMLCIRPSCHRRLLSALHHQAADCFISLDPGVVVRLRPVLPQKVREGLQQDCSDEGIMLWSDPIGDMSLAQFLEHLAQHFWMPHVLDDQGQRLLQFLALLQHVGGCKEGSRLGKAGEEPFIEGRHKGLRVHERGTHLCLPRRPDHLRQQRLRMPYFAPLHVGPRKKCQGFPAITHYQTRRIEEGNKSSSRGFWPS